MHSLDPLRPRAPRVLVLAMLGMFLAQSAFAGTAAPWDTAFQIFVDWLTGTSARLLIIIAAAIALYGLMFAEGGSVWRRFGYVGFAAAALGVITNIVDQIFGTGGALLTGP